MGFYVQDDYYSDAVEELTEREQEQFWAALIRFYFDPEYDINAAKLPKHVRTMAKSSFARIKRSKKASNDNKSKRNVAQQNEKRCKNVAQQNGKRCANVAQQNEKRCKNVAQQNENYPSKNQESESERESENPLRDSPIVVGLTQPEVADEIETIPSGFPEFMAGCVDAFNRATGQAYAYPTAKARDGMLRVFWSGRTLGDVESVMADVATWDKRYQTPEAVFADGKFEKHLNRPRGGNDYAYLDNLPNG